MIQAGGTIIAILAWLGLCSAVSGALYLALHWPRRHRFRDLSHDSIAAIGDPYEAAVLKGFGPGAAGDNQTFHVKGNTDA